MHSEIDPLHRPPRRGERLFGMSRAALYRAVRDGLLEAPVRVGLRAVAWRESQLDAYLKKISALRREVPGANRARHSLDQHRSEEITP